MTQQSLNNTYIGQANVPASTSGIKILRAWSNMARLVTFVEIVATFSSFSIPDSLNTSTERLPQQTRVANLKWKQYSTEVNEISTKNTWNWSIYVLVLRVYSDFSSCTIWTKGNHEKKACKVAFRKYIFPVFFKLVFFKPWGSNGLLW